MPTRPRVESGGGVVVLRSLDGGGDMRDELGVADVMELEGLIADRCGTISAEVSVAVEWMDIRVFSNALDAERLCATPCAAPAVACAAPSAVAGEMPARRPNASTRRSSGLRMRYSGMSASRPWADASVKRFGGSRARWEDHAPYLEVLGRVLARRNRGRPLILAGDFNQLIPWIWGPRGLSDWSRPSTASGSRHAARFLGWGSR